MKLIIYCDESVKKGEYFSNFYGGALLNASDYDHITTALNQCKASLNLTGEVKWTKVSHQYLEKYIAFIDKYFEFIKSGKIKIRIMFHQNLFEATSLTDYHKNNEFYLLYYQFIKHAFGLEHCNPDPREVVTIIPYFDDLPDTKEKNAQFKEYISNLSQTENFFLNNIKINRDDISEVNSHNHVILQGMDVILGAMQFRLNKEHLKKLPDSNRRGKKTIAKEKLYNHIYKNICEILPRFNPGSSTGHRGFDFPHWELPYSHWNFIPSEHAKTT